MCLSSLFPSSCTAFSAPKSPIQKFSFNFDGTIGGNSFEWTITRQEDGKGLFLLNNHIRRDYDNLSDTVPEAFMDSLETICRKYSVHRWDGFQKYNKYVSDGTGFSLYIKYADGKSVNAHGMNEFPSHYRDFRDELYALCNPVRDHLMEIGRQRKIEKGVSGDLRGMLWVFSHHYPGANYTYHAFIRHDALTENNVDIEIKHSDGSVFPEGDYRFYCRVTDDKIHWDKFAELIKKHRLERWCDWEQSDDEHRDAEWFQVSFNFDEGNINANGNVHPEEYDAFREDFLQLFVETFGFLFKNEKMKNE